MMRKRKHNRFKRLIAVVLTVVSLLQWVPANGIVSAEGEKDYLPGDVNGDSVVNALDVNLVRRYIAGGYDVTINTLAADVDANGTVDGKDVQAMRHAIVGGYGVELKPGLDTFIVKFQTGGGNPMADKAVLEGTPISSLATPYWEEHIFLGWYYDAELKQIVESDDRVTQNMTLYAGWLEQAPLDTLSAVNFTSATDVAPDFAVTVVTEDMELTAEDVLALVEADDLSDPDAKDILSVTGEKGTFTLRAKNGFREGGSYRITLGSDKLTFKDQPETARDFNFTVHRDQVMNLTAQAGIKYLPVGEVCSIVNNGQAVETLNLSLYESNGTDVAVADMAAGSFTYTGGVAVQKGDVVCVYEGLIPTERTSETPADQLGDMAYVTITGVRGNSYTYESADAEDVVFTPDVLPMPETADMDSDEATITVENKFLDYSADIYSYNNLDSQTTVEAGDFLAFYTGDYGVQEGENAAALSGYGKITAVKANEDETTTITYVAVTWEEVESCMDVYTEKEVSAQELLKGVNIDEVESEIEQQAWESGFAEDAALYLTSLALATDNFNALSENVNLEDYKVTLSDGATVSPEQLKLMSGGSVEVEIEETDIKAKISKSPTHLGDISGTNADKKGIALSLDVTVIFTVTSAASDGHLEITITGSFVEEIGFDFGASAEAIWDWAVIIPYISDIRATANVDVINYTAISFNATMITKENDDDDDEDKIGSAIDVANEIKDLLAKNTEEDKGDENHNKLIQRYSEMINQESDWIRIVEKNISEVKQSFPPSIPLLNLSLMIDFVVQMDASISIGFDFEYLEGKRYVFTVSLAAGKVYSDTIDLAEKSYEFCFYVMGRIGLKMGIELDFSIYAISKKLGSIGFTAGAGAYTKLYGYFFYELQYTASQGKTQKYSGALLVQVGIYLQLGLEAQALGGRYSARANLLDKEWLIYQAGRRDNVLDFVVEQEEIPQFVMRQYVKKLQVSDQYFNMEYLDLITGNGETAVYNDWNDPERAEDFRNGENFVITMSNDKFKYDPQTNSVMVYPDPDDIQVTGEMTITWKKKPMSFSSKPITRTISLYWDNLRDGYMIVPYTNGGSYVPMIVKAFEAEVEAPADPEKLGYTFAGWYSDATLETAYTFPEIMPADDINVYAKWEPRTDTPYTVEHYKEDFRSGEYELVETENFTGTTDSYVTPEVNAYTGYVTPAQAQLKVEADGSAVLRYYYNLERHTVTFDSGKVDGVDVTAEPDVTYTLKYGAPITAPHLAMKGYSFAGWSVDGETATTVANSISTEDLTYTAMWLKDSDTPYRIEYYVQQADGRYTLQHMIQDETATGAVFTADYLRGLTIDGEKTAEEKYTLENAIVFENITVKGIACDSAVVDGDGKTVIKVNYGRVKHQLVFDLNYAGAEPIVKDVFYEAEVIVPQNVLRTGYTFVGWEVAPVNTMPAYSLTYKAVWTPNKDTAYKVEHYQEQLDGSYALADTDNLTGTTDTSVTPAVKNYTGFTAPEKQTVTILADGTLVVQYHYTRNTYTLSFDANGGEVMPESITAKYGQSITLPVPQRVGYGFDGWYNGNEAYNNATMGAEDLTVTAQWTAGKFGYTVNHYQQNLDGNGYTLVSAINSTAAMDEQVTPERNTYEGFTAPEATTTITIQADASENVVDYYYTRNQYTITWELGIGSADGQSYTSGTVYYGTAITAPVPAKTGYTFVWDKMPATTMPAGNVTYTAIWTENTYKVTFQANNGTAEEITVNIPYTGVLGENTFAYAGYSFLGWSDGINTYGADTKLSQLVAEGLDTLRLTAVWELQKYTITYVGVEADEHDNAAEYTVYDAVSINEPYEKPGFTFLGWYDNSLFEGDPVTAITVGSTGHKVFYASWYESSYTVVLNANDGTGAFYTTDPILYSGTVPENTFSRPGYTFLGWAASPDGEKAYDNAAAIVDIAGLANGNNQVTLYAVWELNVYEITYTNWGVGASSNPNASITSYSSESEGDIVLENPTAKSGFQFLGWYDGETKVTTIPKTAGKDYNLTAKWAHGGTFNVAYTSTKSYVSTYTVTRTIPDGAEPTADPQVVYIRTANDTAYGTTPEVASASQQDKYHFVHIDPSKEGSGKLTFTSSDLQKTFTVQEKDDYNADNPISSYQIGGTARYYKVELYKVIDATGNCPGVLGSKKSIYRKMPVSNYQISSSFYGWKSKTIQGSSAFTIDDSGYDKNTYKNIYLNSDMNSLLTSHEKIYRDQISCSYGFYFTFDLREVDDAYQWIKVTGQPDRAGSTLAEYHFATKDGETASNWGRNLRLPRYYDFDVGDIEFDVGGDCHFENNWNVYDSSASYAVLDKSREISICFDSSGKKGSDEWQVRNLIAYYRVYDATEPAKRSVAPLALTSYKKGEEVRLTVIFSEPINSISGTPKLEFRYKNGTKYKDSMLATYFESATYDTSCGTGTNALVFTCKATKDLTADDIMKINEYLAYNESNVGGSFNSNIGTLTASVYDLSSD